MRLPVQVEVIPYRYTPDISAIGRGALEILALHRIPKKGGFWQPVTGGVETTDLSEDAAALREVCEELNVDPEHVVDLARLDHEFSFVGYEGIELTEKVFRAELVPDAPVSFCSEHDAMRWGPPPEIRELYKYEDNKIALDLLVRSLGAASASS